MVNGRVYFKGSGAVSQSPERAGSFRQQGGLVL